MESLKASDPTHIASYELLGRLGAGGMGLVYLARSRGRRLVAVKVIQTHLTDDPEYLERFRREVEAAKEVSGFYTAPVIDADLAGRPAWLATSYIDGPNLDTVVAKRGRLDRRAVTTLAAALAEALKAIHSAKLVHRDLKPSNILLAADGPRVIDFGIVRAADSAELTGHPIGTPAYMSPEQAKCTSVGPESDVFSLGGVLYFAATGHRPFGTGDIAAVLRRVVEAEPDLARVPHEHRELIGRCLARQPSERPTPDEILDDLNDADAAVDTHRAGTDWTSGSLAPLIKEHVAQTALYTRHTDPQGRYRLIPETAFESEPDPLAEELSAVQADARHPRRLLQWPTRARGSLWLVLSRRRGGLLMVGLGVALAGTVVAVLGTAALRDGSNAFRPWSVDNINGDAVVVGDGLVYVGREKGIAAYDSRTGKEHWESESRDRGMPIGRYGALLLARSGKSLVALDPRSGKRRWRVPLRGDECITAQSDSVAVVDPLANGEHLLSIFDTATGARRWAHNLDTASGGCAEDGVRFAGGRVGYVRYGGQNAGTDILNSWATDSGAGWSIRPGAITQFAADAKNVYVAVADREDGYRIHAYAADTGRLRWGIRFRTVSADRYFPDEVLLAANGSRLYALGADGLYAFETANGHRRWKSPLPVLRTPKLRIHRDSVQGDMAYVQWDDTKIGGLRETTATAFAAIHLSTGEQSWRKRIESTADIASFGSDMVYIDSSNVRMFRRDSHELVALEAHTGEQLWRQEMNIDGATASSGILYVCTGDTLEAINATTGKRP